MTLEPAWLEAIARHDAQLEAAGVTVWLGAEPTFTRRDSQDWCWLGGASGGDKLARARDLLVALAPRLCDAAELGAVVGRKYSAEDERRFALAMLWSRSGAPLRTRLAPLDGEPTSAPSPRADEALLTITPDPGVVEVNLAPAPDLATFARWVQATHEAAREVGLSPERFRYNGDAVDSGGGGQLTLGGPTPDESPFFVHPQLLPRWLAYTSRHPALSYWFASECVGSASQGPRPDEGVRERFEELGVTLARLRGRGEALEREELGAALCPLLVDASGNAHRAEINVEKLWSELPERGRLGLCELRALRMERTPERMIAVAALFRSLAARLALHDYEEPLAEWGAELHDRFALPSVLIEDLVVVLADLRGHGFDLGEPFVSTLLAPREQLVRVALPGATLTISPALEFWPLVGDVASQEQETSRVVDSSTARVEVRVDASDDDAGELTAQGYALRLTRLPSGARVAGVRRRTFVPRPGLHPGLPAQDPLVVVWQRAGRAVEIALHGWMPDGGAYDGLPVDASDAERRRRERVILRPLERAPEPRAAVQPGLTLDLRRHG